MTLNAQAIGLVPSGEKFAKWKEHMRPDSLQNENWLLAYEARVKKWLPPLGPKEYIKTTTGLGLLGNANVSFYNASAHTTYVPASLNVLRMKLMANLFEDAHSDVSTNEVHGDDILQSQSYTG